MNEMNEIKRDMKLKYNIEIGMDCEDERTLYPYDNDMVTRRVGDYFKEVLKKDDIIKDIKIEGVIEL